MDHDDGISNTSSDRSFPGMLRASASRRQVLSGSLAVAATGFVGAGTAAAWGGDGNDRHPGSDRKSYRPRRKHGRSTFAPVPLAQGSGPEPSISSNRALTPGAVTPSA